MWVKADMLATVSFVRLELFSLRVSLAGRQVGSISV